MPIYNKPEYYDIAFDFIDIKKQIDLFEEFIKRFSRVKVRRVLDLGCGPGSQLIELAHRGYDVSGLDISPQMLGYLKKRALNEGITVETIKEDMSNFRMKKKVDFIFIMMGTIGYIKDNEEFLRHLNSVSSVLKPGGLYLIEDMRLNWPTQNLFKPQRWVIERNGVRVKATYQLKLTDALNQTLTESIKLEVKDHNRAFTLEDSVNTKQIFPQEFLELLKENGKFEFLGWFKRDKIEHLKKADKDNVILLRRL